MYKYLSFLALSLVVLTASAFADPYCRACPNSCEDLGIYDDDDCEEIESGRGLCCVELSKRGRKLVDAQDAALGGAAAVPQPAREVCPAGFQPSERKCSDKERRNGCKDVRLPGGLGCVRR